MTRVFRQIGFMWLCAGIVLFLLTSILHLFYFESSVLFTGFFHEMWEGSWATGFYSLVVVLIMVIGLKKDPQRSRWLAKGLILLMAYIIVGIAAILTNQYFFTQTHLLFFAFFATGVLAFFLALHFRQSSPILRMGGVILLVSSFFAGFGNWLPQVEGGYPPEGGTKKNVFEMTTQQRADLGEEIIFGGLGQSKVSGAIGRGQCPLCHTFFPEHQSERAPNLWGITARKRLHATSIEYIAESHVCPTCYVVGGFGVKGTQNRESPMPRIHKPPISLTIPDLIAVDTWLFVKDGETPPHPKVIEDIYHKLIPEGDRPARPDSSDSKQKHNFQRVLVTGEEPIGTIFTTAGCTSCHAIPGLNSYRQHWTKGKSFSLKTLDRSAISKAILDPTHHPIKLYPDHKIPKDYGRSITALALAKMVDYLAKNNE